MAIRILTEQEIQSISLFIDGDISPHQLLDVLGKVPIDTPSLLLLLLESAVSTSSPRKAELAFCMLRFYSEKKAFAKPAVPLLLQLLLLKNHWWHEDIIGAFRYMKDERTVDAVYTFISNPSPDSYPHTPIICRKAAWALANVGNENAYQKLNALVAHSNPTIAAYALKRIQAWGKEQGRKSHHFLP